MKLATLDDGSRDGQLVVVSRDLTMAHPAQAIAGTLQAALDDWNFIAPQLEDLSSTLNQGKARHSFAFEPARCRAPLPRAYQWVEPVAGLDEGLVMAQRSSDAFLGPGESVRLVGGGDGIAGGAALAVVTGDVEAGISAASALEAVRLLLLAMVWHCRSAGSELAAAAFAPVAVTPDELAEAWRGGRVNARPTIRRNGRPTERGSADGAPRMRHHFGRLIAQTAAGRRLGAGSIVGGGALVPVDADSLHDGDRLGIELVGSDGQSVFGAIEQGLRLDAVPAAAPESAAAGEAPLIAADLVVVPEAASAFTPNQESAEP